jgi:hypothetical protein
MFAEVFPDELSLEISNNKIQNKIPSLTLKNTTDKYLIYKFLINTRGVLLAKPPTSFIKPFQSVSIVINIINSNLPVEEYIKTKLLIMFIKSDEEIKTVEQAKQKYKLLKNEINREIEKQELLININVINNEENNNKEEEKVEEKITNFNNNNEEVEERIIHINYEQLKIELDSKNKDIKKNLEIQRKRLENLIGEENKTKATKGKRKKYYNLDNLIMVFIILIGLIIGANFACGYNKLFKK